MTPIRWLFGYGGVEQQETFSLSSDDGAQFVDTQTSLATHTLRGKNSLYSIWSKCIILLLL